MEDRLIPYSAVDSLPCRSAIVFAPHPGDEVFGCGGALALHAAAGTRIAVVVLSDGAYGLEGEVRAAAIAEREAESCAAARMLGIPEPSFWRLPDRSIEYGEALIRRIMEAIRAHDADLVYAPSVHEAHPDHRMIAMAVVEAIRRLSGEIKLAMYEVGVPLRPNLLLDISKVFELKRAAMRCFSSQLARQPYDEQITALNRYRTYTLPMSVSAAEAYEVVDATLIKRNLLSLYESELDRLYHLGLASEGRNDLPLVSVIIRSMDRPTLAQALNSVALQTYPNIEVVVVNARGGSHSVLPSNCGRFPIRLINQDGQRLTRPQAANVGLEAAQGTLLIFLDDDDRFEPEHISLLVQAYTTHADIQVVYAGVRVEAQPGKESFNFNQAFDPIRLLCGNFIPIHAAIFSRELVRSGCKFDESLDVYEDWDFWLQLSKKTNFHHVDQVSAVYNAAGNSGVGLIADVNSIALGRLRIYEKWSRLIEAHTLSALADRLNIQSNRISELENQINIIKSENNHFSNTDRENRLADILDYAKSLQAFTDQIHTGIITSQSISSLFHNLASDLSEIIESTKAALQRRDEIIAQQRDELASMRERQQMLHEQLIRVEAQLDLLKQILFEKDARIVRS